MSKDKPALPDDETKRKFREALERKKSRHVVAATDGTGHGKVDHASGPESHQKMFRRKAGG